MPFERKRPERKLTKHFATKVSEKHSTSLQSLSVVHSNWSVKKEENKNMLLKCDKYYVGGK